MIDINYIRENKDKYKEICENKGVNIDIDALLSIDQKRRDIIKKVEDLRSEQNKLRQSKNDIEEGRKIKKELKPLEKELKKIEKEYEEAMLYTPNIYSEDTPIGPDDSYNKEFYKWGDPKEFDFTIKSHIELGEDLDIIDLERGVRTSGFRGYYLKNEGALLHFALLWHSFNKIISKGFTPLLPPTIVREFALVGSGDFPFLKEDIYQIANPGKLSDGSEINEPEYLVGTSEPSLLAYFKGRTFEKEELPKKVCAFTPCYRSEIGSYGKDTKGLYRIHEFMKVEQVVIAEGDVNKSNRELEEMKKTSQEVLEDLNLPYRIVQVASGDMGAGKYKMYDIETWMPSRENFGETHSDSNLTDWQARRLNIKYKDENGKKRYVHTLNDTVVASPRILIALLENHQRKDGGINVPPALHPYLDFKVID